MTKKKTTPPAKPRAKAPAKPRTKALPAGKKKPAGKKARAKGSTKSAPPGGAGASSPAPDPEIIPLRQVADWILRGENEISIKEAIRATFPNHDALELLTDAAAYLGELAGTDPELRRTWHIAARRELYRRTVEIHDFKTARDIIRDLAQLEGLYPRMTPTRSKPARAEAEPNQKDESAGAFPTADGFPTLQ